MSAGAHGPGFPPVARDELLHLLDRPFPRSVKQVGLALAAVGGLIWLYGVGTGQDRVWHATLMNWLFFAIIASAGVMFAAVQRLTTARWSRPVVRFLEGFSAFLPVAFVFLLLIIFVAPARIYPWWDKVGTAELIPEKNLYFQHGFFWARSVGIFGALVALQLWYVYTSLRLDVGVIPERGAAWAAGLRARMRAGFGDERRELHTTHSRQGVLAVVMALLFGFGWTALAWDHSMSLDYHFFSTMYGWQVFMGGWLAMLMTWSLLVRGWKRHLGGTELINESHYHDIGKLCFAFTAFWGYITFSQYLVIWYGNLAEETHFFRLRLIAPWKWTTVSVAFLTFAAPFFGLLSVKAKTYTPTMALFATSSLLGIWLARFTEVYPSLYTTTVARAPLGLFEVGTFLFMGGLFVTTYALFFEAFPAMRVVLQTSPFRDEVQVPVDPKTMEPLPAHE